MRPAHRTLLRLLGFIVCLGGGYALGKGLKDLDRGVFLAKTQGLDGPERARLERNVALAISNAAWILGDKSSARRFADRDLSAAPEDLALEDRAVATRRVRALLRIAALETHPEGQSAILNSACALQEDLCEGNGLLAKVKAETDLRLVAPGNQPPLFLQGIQHPDGACEF